MSNLLCASTLLTNIPQGNSSVSKHIMILYDKRIYPLNYTAPSKEHFFQFHNLMSLKLVVLLNQCGQSNMSHHTCFICTYRARRIRSSNISRSTNIICWEARFSYHSESRNYRKIAPQRKKLLLENLRMRHANKAARVRISVCVRIVQQSIVESLQMCQNRLEQIGTRNCRTK